MVSKLGLDKVAYFYSAMFGAALLLGWLNGTPLFNRTAISSLESAAWLGSGVLIGALLAALSVLSSRFLPGARRMDRMLAEQVGPVDMQEAVLMAGYSGLAEELLFRGALLPLLGIGLSSALFMLAHLPPRRQMWPWTLMSGVMGVALAVLTTETGTVLPAIGVHFTINAINLVRIGRLASDLDAPPSGA